MSAEGKLRVLAQIANRLNAAEIQWALGASAMLYLNGVADRFDDLDIMVQTDQALRAKDILKSMGAMKAANPAAAVRSPGGITASSSHTAATSSITIYFFEFVIGGVDVDLMGGFTIREGEIEHDCSLKPFQIAETREICGEKVPLQALSVWREYYEWMGRRAKVEMIDARNRK